MKPHLLKIELKSQYSFSIRLDKVPYFYNRWHFHEELELVHIHKGMGTQFIGLNIGRFKSGDMILVGSNLAHMWRCDDIYFEKRSRRIVEAAVIHFHPCAFGDNFFNLPEHKPISSLLRKAKHGLKIEGRTKQYVQEKISLLFDAKGIERTILLLNILDKIAHSRNFRQIAIKEFLVPCEQQEANKLNEIYQYIFSHFTEKISLGQIATVANMSPKAFCRYFKNHTKKTFSHFLIEVRIAQACKLLSEKDISIAEVCYQSGFKNLSNFNHFFKKITHRKPFQYKKQHWIK